MSWGRSSASPPTLEPALLPKGLTVETFDGAAWVGLVPFEMTARWPSRGPVPWLSRFPETNVRTYVTAGDGTTGVWFLSLDAARLAAVVNAPVTYALPYYWSAMSVDTGPLRVTYRSRRRWPAPVGASSEVTVDTGDRYAEPLVHWSPGVDVQVGSPYRVSRTADRTGAPVCQPRTFAHG